MVPIMRPKLVSAMAVLPYLRQIDENRWYSNWGPLNAEYERRLSEMFNAHVVTCSSATAGLTAALMALFPYHYKTRRMIGVTSWTFCATVSAVFASGNRPLLLDVGEDNVLSTSSSGGCQGYVVTCPLGAPIDIQRWQEFSDTFKIPVVIDAAASFDSLHKMRVGKLPVVVSTHCTKVMSSGEGGFVLSQDKELIEEIRRITNHGMLPNKNIEQIGFNGKLSEYHAAVGLAELDAWPRKREQWLQVQEWYGEQTDWVTSTHDELLAVPAAPVVERLAEKGIQSRASWYGLCHLQDAYTKIWTDAMGHDGTIKMPMARTEMLREKTIFLPKFCDMKKEEVFFVLEQLDKCL